MSIHCNVRVLVVKKTWNVYFQEDTLGGWITLTKYKETFVFLDLCTVIITNCYSFLAILNLRLYF